MIVLTTNVATLNRKDKNDKSRFEKFDKNWQLVEFIVVSHTFGLWQFSIIKKILPSDQKVKLSLEKFVATLIYSRKTGNELQNNDAVTLKNETSSPFLRIKKLNYCMKLNNFYFD